MPNSNKSQPKLPELIHLSNEIAQMVNDKLYEFYKTRSYSLEELIQLLVPAMITIIENQISESKEISESDKMNYRKETLDTLQGAVNHVCDLLRGK